jgi:hypothetical protein
MRKILEKIGAKTSGATLLDIRVETIRFRKLLENTRAALTLLADGREKLKGEYIFDRQYALSVMDDVLERAGMMAFDATVLSPGEADFLYRLLDSLVASGRKVAETTPGKETPGGMEPEFALLSHILDWLEGGPGKGESLFPEFFGEVFDRAVPGLVTGSCLNLADSFLEITGKNGPAVLAVIDLAGSGKKAPGEKTACPPLGVMLLETRGAEDLEKKNTGARWLALADGAHLSLRALDPSAGLRMEATLSGHEDSDFVFTYSRRPVFPENGAPRDLRTEKTRLGHMAWMYGVPARHIEECLVRLGAALWA